MRLKIVHVGEPALRQPARPLTPAEIAGADIQRLIADMWETMRDAPGVGLAAPQVGLNLQLAVIEDREEYLRDLPPADLAARARAPVPFHVIVNPVLRPAGEAIDHFEGCLSLPGFTARVPRAARAVVDCLDETGAPRHIEAAGWYARILQHEVDHLFGHLYIDRMQSTTFSTLENFRRFGGARPE